MGYDSRRYTAEECVYSNEWIQKDMLDGKLKETQKSERNIIMPLKWCEEKQMLQLELKMLIMWMDMQMKRITSAKEIANFLKPYYWFSKINIKFSKHQIYIDESSFRQLAFNYNGKVFQLLQLPKEVVTLPHVYEVVLEAVKRKIGNHKSLKIRKHCVYIGANSQHQNSFYLDLIMKEFTKYNIDICKEKSQLIPNGSIEVNQYVVSTNRVKLSNLYFSKALSLLEYCCLSNQLPVGTKRHVRKLLRKVFDEIKVPKAYLGIFSNLHSPILKDKSTEQSLIDTERESYQMLSCWFRDYESRRIWPFPVLDPRYR